MKLPQTGGCQCGALRYEVTEAPQMVYTCHCTDCQRLTSSAFSMAIVVADGAFRLTRGEPRPLQKTADSGRVNTVWDLPAMRFMDLRRSHARLGAARAGRHAGRHFLAAADGAFLDPQQTALGRAARGRPELRDAARGPAGVPLLDSVIRAGWRGVDGRVKHGHDGRRVS